MAHSSNRNFQASCSGVIDCNDELCPALLDEKDLHRMASIGLMAAGLSHQLSNRFTSMLLFAEFLERDMKRYRGVVLSEYVLDEALIRLKKITVGIRQSDQILKGLLNRAVSNEDPAGVSVKELVGSAIEVVRSKTAVDRIILEECISDNLPKISGSFIQLQEAFVNIIDNSFYSMKRKESSSPCSYRPVMKFTAAPGNIPKLFTPLFSTKKVVKEGHGIGLFVVKHIIEKLHYGKIVYSSDFGQWTRVRIELPLMSVKP